MHQETQGPNWFDEDIYETKSLHFKSVLGDPHPTLIAALIGWDLGGPVDLWIYPNHNSGTIFTTMQLVIPGDKSRDQNQLGMYELAAATRHQPQPHTDNSTQENTGEQTPFDNMVLEIRTLLTGAARYSGECPIEPLETAEVEADEPGVENTCLIFDTLIGRVAGLELSGEPYGVILVMKVHPSELQYARQNGTPALIGKLKDTGVYPFSDLDRESVV